MTAIIYLRVSTDEQALGFSLTDQEKRLTEYCIKNQIEIKGIFTDDFTGKTFERPGFKKLISFLQKCKYKGGVVKPGYHSKSRGELSQDQFLNLASVGSNPTSSTLCPDQVLFTKWSRFSRNTTDSYNMIRQLQNLGVSVQAIDEPVDFAISQNKAMLALYLVMPEIDNDMRADNTVRGMRRGIKEGRYVSRAPQGYLNKRDDQGKPILAIDTAKANLIKEMFQLMATGEHTQQEVRRLMHKKGLKYCRTKFTDALRNVTYIGKLNLPSYKTEESEIVSGIHEPIISETLFYRVQDVLNGKKRPKHYAAVSEELQLRGFMYCSTDHKMTGSCSRGHGGNYHYYHCPNRNCERHRADQVNESYLKLLQSFKIDSEIAEVYEETVLSFFKSDKQQTNSIQQQIKAQGQKLEVLQDKLIDGTITPNDYQQIKTRYESKLFELKGQLQAIALTESEFSLNFGNSIRLLTNLPEFYSQSDTATKREIIGSITPGKLYFENKIVRTSELNQAIALIATIDKGYSEAHVLQKVQYEDNVPYGAPNGALVRTLQTDLASLSRLYKLVA